MKNFYELFGIDKSQSCATIRSQLRPILLATHPDKNPTRQTKIEGRIVTFTEATEAMAALGTEAARQTYDEALAAGNIDDMDIRLREEEKARRAAELQHFLSMLRLAHAIFQEKKLANYLRTQDLKLQMESAWVKKNPGVTAPRDYEEFILDDWFTESPLKEFYTPEHHALLGAGSLLDPSAGLRRVSEALTKRPQLLDMLQKGYISLSDIMPCYMHYQTGRATTEAAQLFHGSSPIQPVRIIDLSAEDQDKIFEALINTYEIIQASFVHNPLLSEIIGPADIIAWFVRAKEFLFLSRITDPEDSIITRSMFFQASPYYEEKKSSNPGTAITRAEKIEFFRNHSLIGLHHTLERLSIILQGAQLISSDPGQIKNALILLDLMGTFSLHNPIYDYGGPSIAERQTELQLYLVKTTELLVNHPLLAWYLFQNITVALRGLSTEPEIRANQQGLYTIGMETFLYAGTNDDIVNIETVRQTLRNIFLTDTDLASLERDYQRIEFLETVRDTFASSLTIEEDPSAPPTTLSVRETIAQQLFQHTKQELTPKENTEIPDGTVDSRYRLLIHSEYRRTPVKGRNLQMLVVDPESSVKLLTTVKEVATTLRSLSEDTTLERLAKFFSSKSREPKPKDRLAEQALLLLEDDRAPSPHHGAGAGSGSAPRP